MNWSYCIIVISQLLGDQKKTSFLKNHDFSHWFSKNSWMETYPHYKPALWSYSNSCINTVILVKHFIPNVFTETYDKLYQNKPEELTRDYVAIHSPNCQFKIHIEKWQHISNIHNFLIVSSISFKLSPFCWSYFSCFQANELINITRVGLPFKIRYGLLTFTLISFQD